MQLSKEFRQGTVGRMQSSFILYSGELEPQPVGYPTISIIYIDPTTLKTTTAVPTTLMKLMSPGMYYYDWHIAVDQVVTEYQITYRGVIEGEKVIGEDVVTVLPRQPKCAFSPCTLESSVCKPASGCCKSKGC